MEGLWWRRESSGPWVSLDDPEIISKRRWPGEHSRRSGGRPDPAAPPGRGAAGAGRWSRSSRSTPAAASRTASAMAMIDRGRAARLAPAGRHHHRGHRRQHRRRPGDGRGRQGLPLHLRPARQDERREDPPAQGLRRRGRHHADRRRRPIRPRATTASPTGWPARSPAPGGPTSSPTWPTPRSTTAPPARRSGSRPRAGSPPSSPASAPAARSPASAATSRSRTPTIKIIGADPEGSVLSGDSPQAVEGRGDRRGLRAQDVQQPAGRRVGPRRRRRVVPHRPRSWPAARACSLGGSSGTAVAAALRYARRLGRDDLVVALCCRHGPQLPEQVLRRRLAGREQADAATSRRRTRSATCCRRAARGSW